MPKKKAKAEPAPGVNASPEQLNSDLASQLPALEAALKERRAEADERLRVQAARESELRRKTSEAASDSSRTLAIAADLAREYKAVQEALIGEINSLESRLTEYREEAEMARHEMALMARDKDDEIAIKDQTIYDLRMKITEMSGEFAQMLANTVELMRQKLNEVTRPAGDAAGSLVNVEDAMAGKARVAYLQRLQDFTVTN